VILLPGGLKVWQCIHSVRYSSTTWRTDRREELIKQYRALYANAC